MGLFTDGLQRGIDLHNRFRKALRDFLTDPLGINNPANAPAPPPELENNGKFNDDAEPPPDQPSDRSPSDNRTINIYPGPTIIFQPRDTKYVPIIPPNSSGDGVSVPGSKLPKEADGQTEFDTPAGKSIDLKRPLPEHTFGKLLIPPLSSKTLELNKVMVTKQKTLETGIQEESEKAMSRIASYWAYQHTGEQPDDEIEPWDLAAFALPENLRALSGEIGLIYGVKPLIMLDQWLTLRSLNSYFPLQFHIPKKYKLKEYSPNLEVKSKFSDSDMLFSGSPRLNRIYELLGGSDWFFRDRVLPTSLFSLEPHGGEGNPAKGSDGETIEITDWLQLNHLLYRIKFIRLGLDEFPATVPASLLAYSDNNAPLTLNSLAKLIEWIIREVDGVMGEFPIAIDIDDIDPVTKGKQELKVRLPNLAETLAEMYNLSREASTNSQVFLNYMLRVIPEIIAIKTGVVVTQDYARANASYLGYEGTPTKRKIDFNFNPDDPDSIEKVLTETTKNVVGWKDESKRTVAEYLDRLMFAASIIKATNFVGNGQADNWLKNIEGFLNNNSEENNKAWEEFKEAIKDSKSEYNKNQNKTPDIKEWE